MDKSLIEQSVLTDNITNEMQNDMQCASPERQLSDTKSNSPTLGEGQNDSKLIENSTIDSGRHIIRDAVIEVTDTERLPRHSEVVPPIILENNESSFLCKYPGCNFTTGDAELYLKHEDTHVDIRAVSCDVCGMTFRTYALMRRHQLYVHQGIRTFECQYCSKRFLRKEQFVEHLAKHAKQRPYQCTFCGETFNFRAHLKTHISTEHAGIAAGKTCHLCNFKASSPNAIKIHFATFHMKTNPELSTVDNDRVRDLYGNSHNQMNHSESSAIDLATVSQNFSYMASHYPPYSVSTAEAMIAGPSDLSCRSKVVRRLSSPGPSTHSYTAAVSEQNVLVPLKDDEIRHTCVTSQAGSTVISPPSCQDSSCQRVDLRVRHRAYIKPEPPELIVDDSQNSNVQPTSTMDLSNNEVVETTCNSHDRAGSSESLCRRKIHKHSSSDDTGSESHNSPSNRICLDMPPNVRLGHTCYRYRPYDEGTSQRCREYSRHTCVSHRHDSDGRTRLSDSDAERSVQNDQSDSEERKIFYSRATSTNNSIIPGDVHFSRTNLANTFNNETATFTSVPNNMANYFGRKNIVIRDIESRTLTCSFCGIIFPDQTLYLLHRSLHSDNSPWKCNLCGKLCADKYDFNSHVISKGHY